tara:strand:+ start:567 stop:749 length:183 start_codon:yes stop_codon:yes gene_type:complete
MNINSRLLGNVAYCRKMKVRYGLVATERAKDFVISNRDKLGLKMKVRTNATIIIHDKREV